MEITILGTSSGAVNFAPSTVADEIIQNVRTILATVQNSVPLHRDFGVDASYIDKPVNQAMPMANAAIFDAVNEYEPRCEITKIEWENGNDGVIQPKVSVKINETE